MKKQTGTVYLVGAGPGDVDLITQKGLKLIQKADVIFYDNLVNPDLLKDVRKDCQLIYVGKRGEGTSTDQKLIEDQLVKAAQQVDCVVRLKGGDPFIFGRGGEEAQRLASEKISFEIIPGVSSAIAVPAYAGIPLTHRNFTSTVAFVTGHPSVGAIHESPLQSIDWNALAKIGTLVFLMSVKSIRENMQKLMGAGRKPSTPAAFIRWGTYSKQESIVSNISQIADEIEKRKLMPPAIVVVGEVVKLREEISWFETKPLFGKSILVTRARSQASELAQNLKDLGANVIEVPALEIRAPASWNKVDVAIRKIKNYSWLIFTSVNGVNYFFSRFQKLKKDIRGLSKCKIAAVGPATVQALDALHLKVEKVPSEFNAKKLAQTFNAKEVKGKKILFPRAKEGREELIEILQSKGAKLDCVTVYENHLPKNTETLFDKINTVDCISFASSSSVENFIKICPAALLGKMKQIPCVCIGPQTLQKAKELGFSKASKSKKSTIESLVQSLLTFLSQ